MVGCVAYREKNRVNNGDEDGTIKENEDDIIYENI